MNEIVHHPARELYPLVLDLALDGLPHGVVVAVIITEGLFPAWRELYNDVLRLVASLRRISNDVNVNIPQIGTFAIASLRHAAGIYAGNETGHPYLSGWSEYSLIISWVTYRLHRDLLRTGDCLISIFLDI